MELHWYWVMKSAPPGDSRIDFLYYFATVNNETHPGLARVEGSPVAGEGLWLFS